MQTLAERLAQEGSVNELDAVGWAIRLAKRLEALHALGVFHGSVSPACIITSGPERTSAGRLADVRTTSESLGYQSPERLLGGELSAADDTWALAATLYALLTGSAPFAGNDAEEIKQRILAAAPAPLAVFDVGDDDLQHVIDGAFARDLEDRTGIVSSLRHKLEEWHPDPKVRNLAPLDEDEEVSTSDDDERTMLRSAADILAERLGPPRYSPPASAGGTTPRAGAAAPLPAAPRPVPSSPGSGRGVAGPPPRVELSVPATTTQPFAQHEEAASDAHSEQLAGPAHDGTPKPRPLAGPEPAAPSPEMGRYLGGASSAGGDHILRQTAVMEQPFKPPSPKGSAALPLASSLLNAPGPRVADPDTDLPTTEDEEDAKTVMREFPASVAEAARAAASGRPMPVAVAAGSPAGGFVAAGSPAGGPGSGVSFSPDATGSFAPRAIGGAAPVDRDAGPRHATGRKPEVQTGPMPALFSTPDPGLAAPPPASSGPTPQPVAGLGPRMTVEDDELSDLQATVMREMPALPPEVARRLADATGGHRAPAGLLQTMPMQPGITFPSGTPAPGATATPLPSHHGFGPPSSSPAPSSSGFEPPSFGPSSPPQQPPHTHAAAPWPVKNTAQMQTVPAALQAGQMPMSQAPGFAPSGHSLPFEAAYSAAQGFPPPGMPPQPGPGVPQPWMQAPPVPSTPVFDTNGIPSDPFRQRGRGLAVAAVFALVLAAAITFAVVRYLI